MVKYTGGTMNLVSCPQNEVVATMGHVSKDVLLLQKFTFHVLDYNYIISYPKTNHG